MQETRTRHALGAWVRGTLLALVIVGTVALAAMGPKVLEWERRWMVARCPIAYVGEDGRIHLTNERGTLDVELEAESGEVEEQYVSYFSPRPTWSPNEKFIAYTRVGQAPPNRFDATVVVIEPATGRMWQPLASPSQASFGGWVRDDVINVDGGFVDARTGAFVPKPEWADAMSWLSHVPASGGGGWIIVGTQGLHFRTEDFRIRMPIWSSYGQAVGARVDPSGKWAGWTSSGRDGDIQIKLIEENVAKQPKNVWPPRVGSVFCDWTAEGNIFANVSERGRWGLVILDREGTVLRRIVTDVRPMAGSGASWRNAGGGGR